MNVQSFWFHVSALGRWAGLALPGCTCTPFMQRARHFSEVFGPCALFLTHWPPRAAYWRQCLCHHWSKKWLGANPFLEPMLTSHRENAEKKILGEYLSNFIHFIEENWNKIAACVFLSHFSRPQCVNHENWIASVFALGVYYSDPVGYPTRWKFLHKPFCLWPNFRPRKAIII